MLTGIEIKNHPFLGDVQLSFTKDNGECFSTVLFVGENGCGKTSLLAELANYNESGYVVNRKQYCAGGNGMPFGSLFISQDRKYREAINIISKAISGEEPFRDRFGKGATYTCDADKNLNSGTNDLLQRAIEILNNGRIRSFFKTDKTGDAIMSSLLSKTSIEDVSTEDDIDKYSSGEQEMILRMLPITTPDPNITTVIYDEPETGLHPRWQLQFLHLVKTLCGVNGETGRQLFVATHSENILKSAIDDKDTLIIRMSRKDGKIECMPVEQCDRGLNRITFAELQYLIFDIPSYEYANELLGFLMEKIRDNNLAKIDEHIKDSRHYKEKKHKKERQYGKTTYYTLPVYIRNKYHHPEQEFDEISEEQLRESIQLLRDIIKDASIAKGNHFMDCLEC